MKSLRARLLLLLLGTLGALMAVAGWFSYRAGLQEAGELFDARLVQSTRVLLSLVDEPLSELNDYPGEPIVLRGWHGEAHGVGEALAFDTGHAYENKLAFQVWDARQRLVLRSDSAPAAPLAPHAPGYTNVVIDGARWRVFTMRSPRGRWFQSAELSDIRQELAADIAGGTLLPLLFALPLMALAIVWAVAVTTRSLSRLSHEIGRRDPERLQPLDATQAPREARGLVDAINGLLRRLDVALARERRFVADAAHELRTPISALKVHADNARQAKDATERAESERSLAVGIARVERLAAQLLSLSRAESVGGLRARTRLRLDALVRAEVEDLRPLAERKGQTITLELEEVLVCGDELALELLVRNLVENAVRHTPPGKAIEVRLAKVGAHARLDVEDAGPGIAEAERERVFDRFYRSLDSGEEGSGLGLAIVREAVAAHQASIRLGRSERLGGLAANVTIPTGLPD